jgi:hypothetical protein
LATDRVSVVLDSKSILEAKDGVAVVRGLALKEIALAKRYEADELDWVEKNEVFEKSCEKAYVEARDAALARERSDGRSLDAGKPASNLPKRTTVRIAFEKSALRNVWGNLRKEWT